ncbi:GDSL esterase/lipase [Ananas comosus]|uniref:GDSL esterase/lipase n=1 Tax=Ananas comosus TaxID=4615 RepID=A0A199VV59_ANACO|nr:GDSL esterase/lipase [Ananas comosus]
MAEFKDIVIFLMFMLCQLCALAAALEHSPAAACRGCRTARAAGVRDSTVDPGTTTAADHRKGEFLPYGRTSSTHPHRANVLSFPQQLQNLRNYKTQLTKLVGIGRSKEIIKDAVFVISAGTNDLLQSYLSMNQPNQTMPKYENYLINLTIGVPPFGCLPIVRTLFGVENCSSELNAVATSFNSKLVTMLGVLKRKLRVRAAYMDIFTIMYEATRNPEKFGLLETSKGCCGSGLTEVGDTCKNQTTCEDPHKYVYWDAVHPTERMYEIVTDYAMITAFREIFG